MSLRQSVRLDGVEAALVFGERLPTVVGQWSGRAESLRHTIEDTAPKHVIEPLSGFEPNGLALRGSACRAPIPVGQGHWGSQTVPIVMVSTMQK